MTDKSTLAELGRVRNYIHALMHTCPVHEEVVKIAVELNALISESRLAAHAEREGALCPNCKGSGTEMGRTYDRGPDDYEIEVTCSKCGGTGFLPTPSTAGPDALAEEKVIAALEISALNPKAVQKEPSFDDDFVAVRRKHLTQAVSLLRSRPAQEDSREGFYEKLWKDFVSLQRGDAQGICEKVERYYREQADAAMSQQEKTKEKS